MDYANMLGDSFAYAKNAIVGKWKQYLLFLIATLLLTIPLLGYCLKVFRGEKPAPDVDGWGTLIVDGIKYAIISIIWAIPCILIAFFVIGAGVSAYVMNPAALMEIIGGVLIGIVVLLVVAIITGLLATIGIIRFARTGSMGEAFNFSAILGTIGKIGWASYIIAMIVITVVELIFFGVIECLNFIISPYLGLILEFLLMAPLTLLMSRYLCQVYDSADSM
ncbi:DUF4013 domain-containing protein [Methanoregula sp.]|uniref:DUF4013 domain-containing protein n=1 Tax=Methanoregula sp. TaxID=2052170 RepID=UPI002601FA85|nr:DUF4013 domain-containing protein [Methanoregula sp.]MDD5142966.1 DUF4013 domain-containing protein [Methanoregula sp.]